MELSHIQCWWNGFIYGIISSVLGLILLLSIKDKKNNNEKKLIIDDKAIINENKFSSSISPKRDLEILMDSLESLPQLRSNQSENEVTNTSIKILREKKLSVIKDKLLRYDTMDIINSMRQECNDCETALELDLDIKKNIIELENLFLEQNNESKEFEKVCKHVLGVLSEIGRVIKNQGLEFKKIVVSDLNYKDESDNVINNIIKKNFIISANTSNNNQQIQKFERWLQELIQYIDNYGQDGESCGEIFISDIVLKVTRVIDEICKLRHKLLYEGKTLYDSYKTNLAMYNNLKVDVDHNLQKVDLARQGTDLGGDNNESILSIGPSEKLSIGAKNKKGHVTMLTESVRQITSTMTKMTSLGDTEDNDIDTYYLVKRINKLKLSQELLRKQKIVVQKIQLEIYTILPRCILDFEKLNLGAFLEMKLLLKKSISAIYSTTSMNLKELELLLSFNFDNIECNIPLQGFEDSLENLKAFTKINIEKADYKIPDLNMKLEASSILAATAPSKLPKLPPNFSNSIDSESCLWFNAFCGRMFRDCDKSEPFHEMFCKVSSKGLNKGKLPPMIDKFVVSDFEFGSIPPLFRNMRWLPNGYDYANSNSNLNTDPKDGITPPTYNPENQSDYDIECMADLSFHSGVKFTVSTKIYSMPGISVPFSICIEMKEISGPVLFGMKKGCSFISFLKEPLSRFSVQSEIGGANFDLFKIKDLPILSDFLIKKIKEGLRNKAVYPELIDFELMHPRPWWPEGTRHLYPKTNTDSSEEVQKVQKEKDEIFSKFSDLSRHISDSINIRNAALNSFSRTNLQDN